MRRIRPRDAGAATTATKDGWPPSEGEGEERREKGEAEPAAAFLAAARTSGSRSGDGETGEKGWEGAAALGVWVPPEPPLEGATRGRFPTGNLYLCASGHAYDSRFWLL